METKTIEALTKQGFSPLEIKELERLIEIITDGLYTENSKINPFAVAYAAAEGLTTEGSTLKVREFSRNIIKSMDQFKTTLI